jgi:hypothetical protein
MPSEPLVYDRVLEEQTQGHSTRKELFEGLAEAFGRPVVSFFTSFRYPVMVEDRSIAARRPDAD